MTGFLSALGGRLAERWASLLALPGLLYAAVAAVAAARGWWGLTLTSLAGRQPEAALAEAGVPPSLRGAALTAAFLAGILLGAAGAGLLAQAVTVPVEALWCGVWPLWLAPLTHRLSRRRVRRWTRADERVTDASGQGAARDAAVAARNRISLAEPIRPTWMADRLQAVEDRVWGQYGLDLTSCWPRLWLIVPESVQITVGAARDRFAAAVLTGAWAVLYAGLALLWWPVACVAVVAGFVAWRRARTSAADLADLVEAVVDLYAATLAKELGFPAPAQVNPALGHRITEWLRKGT